MRSSRTARRLKIISKRKSNNMDIQKLKELAKKYGRWSSWAIWNENNLDDTSIISQQVDKLHTNYVIVALNMSKELSIEWSNFHACKRGCHDGKLRSAFNGSNSEVRGAYMTDLLKMIDKNSKNISLILSETSHDDIIKKQKEDFKQELKNVGVTEKSKFILIGREVQKHFHSFTDNKYQSTISLRHYSDYRLKAEQWVSQSLAEINRA